MFCHSERRERRNRIRMTNEQTEIWNIKPQELKANPSHAGKPTGKERGGQDEKPWMGYVGKIFHCAPMWRGQQGRRVHLRSLQEVQPSHQLDGNLNYVHQSESNGSLASWTMNSLRAVRTEVDTWSCCATQTSIKLPREVFAEYTNIVLLGMFKIKQADTEVPRVMMKWRVQPFSWLLN